jgi:hypothetical protein
LVTAWVLALPGALLAYKPWLVLALAYVDAYFLAWALALVHSDFSLQ